MLELIHLPFVIPLLISLAWTVLFSIFNKPSIRGFRNLGILATYILFIIFFFLMNWKVLLVTWACFGICGGLIYILYELIQNIKSQEKSFQVHFEHIIYGLFAWPIMVPEAIEYSLTELGILKSSSKMDEQTNFSE